MSIQNQALFYYRNVCDYQSSIKSVVTLSGAVIAGLAEYSNLIRTIYIKIGVLMKHQPFPANGRKLEL